MAAFPVVEVFADVLCPFAHVGLRRFVERRAAAGRDDLRLHVRAWPLEVVNGAPMDGRFVAEEVARIRAQVAPDLFAGLRADRFPATSLPALALAGAAYRHSLDVGEAVSLELRRLLFDEGADVGDAEVLDALAAEHDLVVGDDDHAAVLADLDEGRRRGVVGSPYFFAGGEAFFCPALIVGHDDEGNLRVEADPARFEAFMAACLAA